MGQVRGTFERMGLTDKETVALIVLGHQYGRCHLDVSGFDGPWYSFDPGNPNLNPNPNPNLKPNYVVLLRPL